MTVLPFEEQSVIPNAQFHEDKEAQKFSPPGVQTWLWMDTSAAAKHGRLSRSYLEKLRLSGGGPPFVKIGRAVRYRSDAFDRWMCSHDVVTS